MSTPQLTEQYGQVLLVSTVFSNLYGLVKTGSAADAKPIAVIDVKLTVAPETLKNWRLGKFTCGIQVSLFDKSKYILITFYFLCIV
jgi:hypothetical protein